MVYAELTSVVTLAPVLELALPEPLVEAVVDAPEPAALDAVSGSVEHAPSKAAAAITLKILIRIFLILLKSPSVVKPQPLNRPQYFVRFTPHCTELSC